LMHWAAKDALFNVQEAFKGVLANFPVPILGKFFSFIVFPLLKPYKLPSDRLGHKVARILLRPSDSIDRLASGIYITEDKNDSTGRLEYAVQCVFRTATVERQLRGYYKKGELSRFDAYDEALEKGRITEAELKDLKGTQEAVGNAIKVDEFSFEGWKCETP